MLGHFYSAKSPVKIERFFGQATELTKKFLKMNIKITCNALFENRQSVRHNSATTRPWSKSSLSLGDRTPIMVSSLYGRFPIALA
jgi:hypothetical protein